MTWRESSSCVSGRRSDSRLRCSSESAPPGLWLGAPMDELIAEGELVGADAYHPASGRVRLARAADGGAVLRFEGYEVSDGPDLYIHLTPDPRGDVHAGGAIELAAVKALSGSVDYDVPSGVDLDVQGRG